MDFLVPAHCRAWPVLGDLGGGGGLESLNVITDSFQLGLFLCTNFSLNSVCRSKGGKIRVVVSKTKVSLCWQVCNK